MEVVGVDGAGAAVGPVVGPGINAGAIARPRAVDDLGNQQFHVSRYNLLALMLLAVLTTGYSTWNGALYAGLGYELITNGILSLAFLFYCCSTSELTSTFPFPGGSYALARCTVGFFPGYLVGCMEIFYYVMSLAYSNGGFVYILTDYKPSLKPYFVVLLLVLIIAEVLICLSRRILWWTMSFLAVGVGVFMCYFSQLNFSEYVYSSGEVSSDDARDWKISIDDLIVADTGVHSLFIGAWHQVIRIMPKLVWMFMGSEYVSLACDDCKRPRKEIPFAQIAGVVIVIVHNMVLPVVAAAMYPGVDQVSMLLLPLNPGN
jgi:ethanolamine permease